MNIGETIRKLREERHWSQEELAGRANVTAASISRIENGKHGPSLQLLESFAHAFGLQTYQVVAMAENAELLTAAPQFDLDEDKLLSQFRKMPHDQRELFLLVGTGFNGLGEK